MLWGYPERPEVDPSVTAWAWARWGFLTYSLPEEPWRNEVNAAVHAYGPDSEAGKITHNAGEFQSFLRKHLPSATIIVEGLTFTPAVWPEPRAA